VHCYNRPCGLHYVPYLPPVVTATASTSAAAAAGSGGAGSSACDTAAAGANGKGSAPPAAAPTPLTPGLLSALSPVFTPDGSQLLFLSLDAAASSGVHMATSALHSLKWAAREDERVGALIAPHAVPVAMLLGPDRLRVCLHTCITHGLPIHISL
jgi:hypothetical protein